MSEVMQGAILDLFCVRDRETRFLHSSVAFIPVNYSAMMKCFRRRKPEKIMIEKPQNARNYARQ